MTSRNSFLHKLVEPHESVKDPFDRIWGSISLASMLMMLVVFALVLVFLILFSEPWKNGFSSQTMHATISYIFMILAFVMARKFHFSLYNHVAMFIYFVAWFGGLYSAGKEDVFVPLGFIPAVLMFITIFFRFKTALKYMILYLTMMTIFLYTLIDYVPLPRGFYLIVGLFHMLLMISGSYILDIYFKAAKKQNEELMRVSAAEEVAQKMASFYNFSSLGTMTSEIMHEINNPLQLATMRSELLEVHLKKKGEDPVTEKMLDDILQAIKKIDRTVKNITKYYRNPSEEKFKKIPMLAIWENSKSLITNRAQKAGITILFEMPDQSLMVESIEFQISQVFINLLNNAIDALENVEDKWIKVKILPSNDLVCCCVINSGPSLDPFTAEEMITTLKTTKPAGKGSGMGLPICKRIIEKNHNGIFGYRVEQEHSCFYFRVKRAFPEETATESLSPR